MNPLAAENIGEENKSNQISESWLFQYLKKRKKTHQFSITETIYSFLGKDPKNKNPKIAVGLHFSDLFSASKQNGLSENYPRVNGQEKNE